MMKRLLPLVMLAALGGCTMFGKKPAAPAVAATTLTAPQLVDAGGAPIERVPYRVGTSSATVELLARQHACTGPSAGPSAGQGAGLVTAPGPVEVYRMQCADGKVFMARCELRQCRKM